MREPRVQTGKRTMVYLSTSLAITAGGIFVCYLLLKVRPTEGQTLNAVLANNLFGRWSFGHWLALITILSEGALLFVAAQTGFIDGPRVMANMAVDSWFPHRFATLSERLTMQNGILLMGGAALLLMIYTHGSISTLVVMYSINVFATFSLSNLGMSRFFIKNRKKDKKWKRHLPVNLVGLILCLTILIITTIEKFTSGGWVTLLITSVVIGVCYLVRRHYNKVREGIRELDETLLDLPMSSLVNQEPLDPGNVTAVQLVAGFNGFGVHTLLSIIRYFPNLYKNIIFVSVAVADSGSFKGKEEVEALKRVEPRSPWQNMSILREGLEYRRIFGLILERMWWRARVSSVSPLWKSSRDRPSSRVSLSFPPSNYSTNSFTTRRPMPFSGAFNGMAFQR